MGLEASPKVAVSRRAVLAGAVATLALPRLAATTKPVSPMSGGGVDISWLPTVEAAGGRFFDGAGRVIDPLVLLKRSGVTFVRLRLWVHPSSQHSSLTEVTQLAKRARRAGLRVGIDLHYSDWWADPGHQPTPAEWMSLSYPALRQEVYAYTYAVVRHLVKNGVVPTVVQPGNEVSNGLLWPIGRLNAASPASWNHITGLLNSGINGIRAATPAGKHINVVLHLASTADDQSTAYFISQVQTYGLRPIDAVGLSYYPQWHGSLQQLAKSLAAAAEVSGRRVLVAETAYPFTTAELDTQPVINSSAVLPSYPATPQGQAGYVRALWRVVQSVPRRRGVGIWWWEGLARDVGAHGSAWSGGMQNATLVDTSGRILPALTALGGH